MKLPRSLDMGFGEMVELGYLEQVFHVPRRTAMLYLKAMHIEPLYVAGEIFFSLSTFKRILYVLSRPGAKGFVFPGSKKKNDPRLPRNPKFLVEVTEEILKQAADPSILAEMSAVAGRDQGLMRKFVSKPGKSEKQEETN